MKIVGKRSGKGKKQKVLEEREVISREELAEMKLDTRVAIIQELIPMGMSLIEEELQREVRSLAGLRYEHVEGGKEYVRFGANPGSIKLAGQRMAIRVPRVRNQYSNLEAPLESYQAFRRQPGEVNETLLRRVLLGISCRDYEAATESFAGSIGLSSSTVSRQFIKATAGKLKEFQERDLSDLDLVGMWLDGKTFADDTMVIALGLTLEGRKVPLGFVQAGTENKRVLIDFLRDLEGRGLRSEAGLLVMIDGSKGLRAAVDEVFEKQAVVQRCQWHKRENVLDYLPKNERASMRKRLGRAYKKATYREAKTELEKILMELESRNLDAAGSLREGLEETLALHRLGVYELLGSSLKTTNCIESVMSLVERRCGKVSHWKNSSQKHRWLAVSLLDIEGRLRRIRGHKHLPLLRESLQEELGISKRKSVA